MPPSDLPDYAVELQDAAWLAIELARQLGASPNSPLTARLYEDIRRIELEVNRTNEEEGPGSGPSP